MNPKHISNKYLDIAMEKVIKQEVNAVLDKIRAEIENTIDQEKLAFDGQFDKGLNMALLIFDKYTKGE